MQRTGALIERLQQQFHQCVSNAELAVTAQFLLAELQKNQQPQVNGSVSVLMPYADAFASALPEDAFLDEAGINGVNKPETQNAIPEIQTPEVPRPEEEVAVITPLQAEEENVPVAQPQKAETPAFTSVVLPKQEEKSIFSIPTFALKQQELNDRNTATAESLHDKYKNGNQDVAVLNEPVRDLRKAIGINDRYRFISELFRNDEVMYERSIKTINTFSVLSEAEYWISRELKLKIGWNEENETVKDFDHLVRRRFS